MLAAPASHGSESLWTAGGFEGRPLADALAELQNRGLKLLFSDRVVDPTMRVESEPRDGSLADILGQLLEAHGLEARRSATGWLVVVRSQPTRTATDPPAPAAEPELWETSQVLRVSDAIVVTPRVELPVHVLVGEDPVRGLEKSDFELWVGGKRQEILKFEVLDLSEPLDPDDRAIAELPAAARRHFLLAFDTGLESPASLHRARALANELVEGGLHPADMVGLATLSELRRPQFALFFTSDRSAALTSIDAVTGRNPSDLISDPLGLVVRPAHPTSGRRAVQKTPKGDPLTEVRRLRSLDLQSTLSEWLEDLEPAAERADRQAALTRLLGLSDSMFELARSLRYSPGRKHVIFFSEGFDDSMLVGLAGYTEYERLRIEEMNRAVESGALWKVDTDQRYGNDAAQSSFDRMLAEFAYSNSVIHAVDTRVDGEEGQPSRSRNGLIELARRTGGSYLPGSGNLATVLASLEKRTSVTYLLSFASPPRKKGGRPPKLRVRLRDGIEGRVLHAPSAPASRSTGTLSNDQRRLMAAGRIAGGSPGGDFPSRLSVSAVIEDDAEAAMQLSVTVEGVHSPAGSPHRTAEVYVYALAADGEIRDYFRRSFYAAAGLPGTGKFRVEGRLRLIPGRYSLRSLVVYPSSGASSLATVELDVLSF